MSGGYLLSPLALADLSDIWDYTYINWGGQIKPMRMCWRFMRPVKRWLKRWLKAVRQGKVQNTYVRVTASN